MSAMIQHQILAWLWLQAYAQERKIPKNTFYAQDDFSKQAEKLFTKDVESVSLVAVLWTGNTNIPALTSEEECYSELFVLIVEIRNIQLLDKIDSIIHQILPNPLLIIYTNNSQILLSVSSKRRSKADKNKQVVENIYITDWMKREDRKDHEEFWNNIHYKSHLFTNLKRFYEWRLYPIIIMQYQSLLWWYRSISLQDMPHVLDIISQHQQLQKQITERELAHKQTLSMWEQSKLYIKIKNHKEQQAKLISSL